MLALAGLLHACSAVKIAYNQAPELAYLYLDSYLDFNSTQSIKAKEELVRLHQWHRQTQLPAYIDSLQKLRRQIPGEMDAQAACTIFTDARGKFTALTDRAEPAVVSLTAMLEPRQLRHMEGKFEKANADYRDDYVDGSPASLRKKRIKEAVKRAEMLYGSLDDPQLAIIGKRVDQSSFNPQKAYAERIRRQRDTVQTMTPLVSGQSAPEKAQIAMRRLLERSITSPDADYRAYAENFTRENCQTFAELHNSTSAEQRAKAVTTLKKYEDDFRLLADQKS